MADLATVEQLNGIASVLRGDVVRMIGVGKAGHLGGSCSLAEIVACLYFRKLRFEIGRASCRERV